MFLGRYLPPECATSVAGQVPQSLEPPPLTLTTEQEFFAGGWLTTVGALGSDTSCEVEVSVKPAPLVANRAQGDPLPGPPVRLGGPDRLLEPVARHGQTPGLPLV